MRNFATATAALLLCAAAAHAQHGRLPIPFPTPTPRPVPTTGGGDPGGPTMKRPEHVEVAPSHQRRSYDAEHDTTYVNVDIPLVRHEERKAAAGAVAFAGRDLVLVFQLAYAGRRTDDLRAAYLVVESTSAPDDPAGRLSGALRLELSADPYEYTYDRRDYKTGEADQSGAAGRDAPPLKREIAVFPVEIEDLQHIADASRLELKLGAESYTVKSPQLTDLRHVLATGDKP
jgi:hypothetical protein